MRMMTKFFVKGALLTTGLLIAGLSLGQEQTTKVTFRHAAAPLGTVLAELSKAANTSLVASAPIASDVILLNLKDVSLQDALAKIASTLHAEWKQEGSGYVLYRGSNLTGADQRAETAAKVAKFRDQIKKALASQAGAFDDKAAKKMADAQKEMMDQFNNAVAGGGRTITAKGNFNDVATQSPAARAITSLVASMSDAQLGMIANRKRIVFSTNPTRMQYGLGNAANQILRRFVQEQLVLTNYNKRNQREDQNGLSQRIVINGFGGDEMGDGNPNLGIGYAMLVSNGATFGGGAANLSLIVTDPNGKTLATGSMFLGNSTFPIADGQKQNAASEAQEKPIEFSPESLELAKALNMGPGGGARAPVRLVSVSSGGGGGSFNFTSVGGSSARTPQLSPGLREKILQPNVYEPMGFAPSEAFLASSDALNKNIVAYLPDTAFSSLNQAATAGKVTPSAFLTAAKQSDLTIVDENGWLLVSPSAPAAARDRHTNRVALANALKSVDKKGYLSLDEMAAYALALDKEPRNGDIDLLYMRLISAPYAQTLEQYGFGNSWQMLQFYGCLSTGQKQAMLQNGRIDMSTLSNQQINLLADDVFSSFDGPEVRTPQDEQNPRMRTFRFGGGADSPQRERTIVLPNGIVRNGYIVVDIQNKQGVQTFDSQAGGSQFMSVDTLAFDRLRMERPEMSFGGDETHPDKFRAASQKTFTFRFVFTPEVSLSRTLEDNAPANTSFGTFDQLPADVRKEIEQRLEAMRQGFGKGFPGGQQGNPPPRPRP